MKEPADPEKSLDPQLWHACAGGMVQMPLVNSRVFYFPQGHCEHASGLVDFNSLAKIPPMILCRVATVRFMADRETDEVFAKIRLIPVSEEELNYKDDDAMALALSESDKPLTFAKTLTQSDANNGGGFSVPRYCAETLFPRLDYNDEPPVQNILAMDVHGKVWKFRHIYRGTPRRHLLTTGWSQFVNSKKLVAGDSIVFLKSENGDLCIGIRRAKRGLDGGHEVSPAWHPPLGNSSYASFFRDDENNLRGSSSSRGSANLGGGGARGICRVRPESIVEAINAAARGLLFEVVYYPRASTPEFCVKMATVLPALSIPWIPHIRFKMAFETEDSTRISWFMGTISSVQVADPVRWPNSPWRLLQVSWDEPDLLQNVKRVSPWLVELVTTMPPIPIQSYSPTRKKPRIAQHLDYDLDTQIPTPAFTGNPLRPSINPLCSLLDGTPAGIQGARHDQYSLSLTDRHLNKLQSDLFRAALHRPDHAAPPQIPNGLINRTPASDPENVSCLLTIGTPQTAKNPVSEKTPHQLMLFGRPILTKEQLSQSSSGNSSDGNAEKAGENSSPEYSVQTGHCKVFMQSEDVGRTLDLSILGSYEELYWQLAEMFAIKKSHMMSLVVIYHDAVGNLKQVGHEPFSDFMKTARRLTILMYSGGTKICQ